MRIIELVGQRFERVLVVSRAPNHSASDTNARWNCICDCGKEFISYGQDLRKGKTKSCGCLTRLSIGERASVFNKRHGMTKTAHYRNWLTMMNRCRYKKPGYEDVKVCDRWHLFENFMADMGERPARHTIDRIDPFGDYSPENCRWATAKMQAQNKRKGVIRLTYDGQTMMVSEWADELGLTIDGMYARLHRNLPPEKLFAKIMRKNKPKP